MTIKRKSILTLINIALVTILCFSIALPMFAANPATGVPGDPAQAALTKIFKMPIGTTIPTVTFTFKIEKVSLDGDDETNVQGILGQMPEVTDITLNFPNQNSIIVTNNGVTTIYRESIDMFDDSNLDFTWPRAGVYEYLITELNDAPQDTFEEQWIYSQASYKVHVYVDTAPDGSLYIAYICGHMITSDDGGKGDDEKVDPTPGWETNDHTKLSGLRFTNSYLKNNGGPDPEDEDNTTLKISKVISGLSANNEHPFEFTITITAPATVDTTTPPAYKAYLMDKDGVVSPIPTNQKGPQVVTAWDGPTGQPNDGREYVVFTSGVTKAGFLKHGQWLNFIDLPVGANFVIIETGVPKYTPSCDLTLEGATKSYSNGPGLSLRVPSSNETAYIGELFEVENGVYLTNMAEFTNTYDMVAPTGISVNDLPYVVLIGIAVAALVGFIIFKSRKREENDA